MATADINNEMKQAAEYAISVARKTYGKVLDYSEDSIPHLDELLKQVYQQFRNQNEDIVSSSNALKVNAAIWGSYLGEIIREKVGGTWIVDESGRWLVVNHFKFSPIIFIFQRVSGKINTSVKQYFDEVAEKLSPHPINPVYIQTTSEETKKSFPFEKVLQIILGVVVLLSLILMGIWLSSTRVAAVARTTQQAVYTQQAAAAVATANSRVHNSPTKTPIPIPTKIRQTPTRTVNINCRVSDYNNYVVVVSNIFSELDLEMEAARSVGLEEVLTSPSASRTMADYMYDHYITAKAIVPPPCLELAHSYLLNYLNYNYQVFMYAAQGDYSTALDYLNKLDAALDTFHSEADRVGDSLK